MRSGPEENIGAPDDRAESPRSALELVWPRHRGKAQFGCNAARYGRPAAEGLLKVASAENKHEAIRFEMDSGPWDFPPAKEAAKGRVAPLLPARE